MQTVWRLYRMFQRVKIGGAVVSGVTIFGMMIFIVCDIVSRNFMSGSINGSYQMTQTYFMPLAIFPGLAYIYASGVVPRMDLLVDKFAKKLQAPIVYLFHLVELVIFVLVTYYSFGFAMSGLREVSSFTVKGAYFVEYPFYFLVPFGFALLTIEVLFVIARNVLEKRPLLSMQTDK